MDSKLPEEPNKKLPGKNAQMFARFASSLAAGLQAEGARRAAKGLSGAGFASAFSSGVQGLTDFTAKLDDAMASDLDRMFFKSIDDTVANEEAKNTDGLREYFSDDLQVKVGEIMGEKKEEEAPDFSGDLEFRL